MHHAVCSRVAAVEGEDLLHLDHLALHADDGVGGLVPTDRAGLGGDELVQPPAQRIGQAAGQRMATLFGWEKRAEELDQFYQRLVTVC